MGYKQEPCPLCGRDMTAIETYPGRGELYCGHCDLTIGGNNAKTPEELIALMDSSEHRRLKAENAKLRELVASVWRLFAEHGAVNPCDLPEVDAVRDRMRELGVEMDA